jgi:hypothetical protein
LSREKSGRSGKDQVNACSLYAFDAADGAGEFAFQRAQMVDVLNEGGRAKRIGLVENLITDAAPFRQPGFGELHTQPGDLVLRHHDDRAVVLDLVGNRLPLEVLDDRCTVIDRKVRKQRDHLRRRHLNHEERKEADQGQRHRGHRRRWCSTQRLHKIEKTLHGLSHPTGRAMRASPGKICPV